MRVEIWSDVTCPWCGLGHHRLDRALEAFEHREHVELVHRSFELDPGLPLGARPVREVLGEKHAMDAAQVDAILRPIEALAASEGLAPYVLSDNLLGNSRLAHELLAMAAERGLGHVAWGRLFRAYFGERRPIFAIDALVPLGQEIGLDPREVHTVLSEGRFRARVQSDALEARELGATGVPFIVIDRRRIVKGAQPVEALRAELQHAWRESPTPVRGAVGGVCTPDGCA